MWMQELQLLNDVKVENTEDIGEIIDVNIKEPHVVQSFTKVEYKNSKHNEELVVVSNSEFDKLKLLKKEKQEKHVTESVKKIEMGLQYIGNIGDTNINASSKKRKSFYSITEGRKVKCHKYQCHICYKLVRSLFSHHKREHGSAFIKEVLGKEPRAAGPCNICDKKVSRLEVHQRKIHGHISTLEVVPCEYCCDWFPNIQSLNEHMVYHDIRRDLRNKMTKKFGRSLYCNLCKFHCFARNGTRNNTVVVASGEQVVRGHRVMKSHMETVHREKHPCHQCGKVYNSASQLKEHAQHCGVTVMCDECPAEFKFNISLENHVEREHRKQFNFKCNLCNSKFSLSRNLRIHEQKHSMPSVVCNECGKSLRNNGSLKTHKLYHLKPHLRCSWQGCSREFKVDRDLANHTRVHTGAKPFKCDQCEQTFRKQAHRSRHKKLHSGEKPYICESCGTGFSQKGNMKVHRNGCTEQELYHEIDLNTMIANDK